MTEKIMNANNALNIFRSILNSDKIFDSLEIRLTKELINRSVIKPFREIKKMDRIEIDSDSYQTISNTSTKTLNTELYMYIPFITKGVMVVSLNEDKHLYYHFTVNEIDLIKECFKLSLDIYSFEDYYAHIMKIDCILCKDENGIFTDTINHTHVWEHYIKLVSNNNIYLSDMERIVFEQGNLEYKENLKRELKSDEYFHILLVNIFANCMVYLNNCIEKQCIENVKYRSKTIKHDAVKLIGSAEPKKNTVKDRIIIINGIKIKKGENSLIKTRQGNVVINRQTQVWGVIGHFRHYKNGKVIYIQPYKKGPGRNKSESGKTIYKLKTEGE